MRWNSYLTPNPGKLVEPERSWLCLLSGQFLHSEQVKEVVQNEGLDGEEVDAEGVVEDLPSVVVVVVKDGGSGGVLAGSEREGILYF